MRGRRGPPARPGRRGGQLCRSADRRRPPRHHRHDTAAAPDHLRRAAGHDADGADERGDPGPGAARGLHAGAHRADHRGAVGAGALRAVLPHRRRLHRGRRADRRVRRAGAAGQRRRVGEQRRCRVHRQDRHADHRAAHGSPTSSRLGDAPGLDARAALGAFAAAVTVPTSPARRSPPPCPRPGAGGRSGTRCPSPRRCAGPASPPTRGSGCSARPRRWRRTWAGRSPPRRWTTARPPVCGCSCSPAPPTPPPTCATATADRPCPGWTRSRSSRSPTSCARGRGVDRPVPYGRGGAQGALRRQPAHRRRPRPPPARRRRAGRGAALDGLHDPPRPLVAHHRLRAGRARAQGGIVASLRRQGTTSP